MGDTKYFVRDENFVLVGKTKLNILLRPGYDRERVEDNLGFTAFGLGETTSEDKPDDRGQT